MIYGKYSFLLATGLPLEKISEIIVRCSNESEIEKALEKEGRKFLERYKLWKEYKALTYSQKLKEPILPIITAMPCVGKTTMAREVATAFGIGNVMGGDSFRAALREYISKEKHPEFHTSIYESWKFFGEETEENIIKGFIAQAKLVNHAIEKIVADRGIRDGECVVFEYLHFLPSQYNPEVLNHPSTIPIVLRLDSEAKHKKIIGERDKLTHFKGNSQRLLHALKYYRIMQEYQCEDARKNNVPVVATDNWDDAQDKVFDVIFERIKLLIETKDLPEPEIVRKLREERRSFSDKM
jgi:2-phosphoglycerate kinase